MVEARLRYRIADKGVLVLWYDLVRPHKIVEDAANEVGEAIHTALDRTIFNSTL